MFDVENMQRTSQFIEGPWLLVASVCRIQTGGGERLNAQIESLIDLILQVDLNIELNVVAAD